MNTAPVKRVDFFENGLCFHCHLLKEELASFREFHETTEAFWQHADKDLQAHVDAILRKYPEADHDDIVDSYSWQLHLNQSRYPDVHRNALIISIYGYVEDQLNGLCRILEESLESRIGFKDLSGRGFERALSFLSKVALFELGGLPTLAFVKHANLLRNALVHAGGTLPVQKDDQLNKFVAESTDLHGEPGAKVRVEQEFVERLINHLETFFGEIDVQVQNFMKRFDAAQQQIAAIHCSDGNALLVAPRKEP